MTSQGGSYQKFIITRGLEVRYPMVAINSSSPSNTDLRDIGIYGLYGNAGIKYGGLYRDSSTKKWTIFSSSSEPDFATGIGTSSLDNFTKGNLDIADLTCSGVTASEVSTFQSSLIVVGQIRSADGTVSSPGISFSGELGSGIYRAAAGRVAVASSGSAILDMNTSRVLLPTCGIYAPNNGSGGASTPSYAFTNSTTSGFRYNGSAVVASVAGNDVLNLSTSSLVNLQRVFFTAAGTAGAPDITFTEGSSNTGIYATGAGTGTIAINFSTGGVRRGYFDSTGLHTTQLNSATITHSGAITVGQSLSLGSNGITTTGTISVGTLTSSGTISVTAPMLLNSNNISGVNSLSLNTLTGPTTIGVSQNIDIGANTLTVSNISSTECTFTGRVACTNVRTAAVSKTASYSLLSGDHMVQFNIATGATCTLPLANSVTGQKFVLVLNGVGPLVVTCDGSDTFQGGLTTITISQSGSAVHLSPSVSGTFWILL